MGEPHSLKTFEHPRAFERTTIDEARVTIVRLYHQLILASIIEKSSVTSLLWMS